MFDTRSFSYCYLFFIFRSAFLVFLFYFSLQYDLAGSIMRTTLPEFLFPGQVLSVQDSDSQKPEEAGLQHSKVYIFLLSAFWGLCGHIF